jgi:hypothetical protein
MQRRGHPAGGRLDDGKAKVARKLREDGQSIREIGEMLGKGKPVRRQTVYRALGMLDS